jgi:hypothetical protein
MSVYWFLLVRICKYFKSQNKTRGGGGTRELIKDYNSGS